MTDLKNNRVNGKYTKGRKKYVSVTTILGIINKEALKYWYGKLIYEGVIANPKLTLAEALKYPYKTLSAAAERGTQIHSIISGSDSFLGEHLKEIAGFEKWKKDYQPEILDQEVTLFHDKLLFAGTYDLRVKIKNKIYICDIKTGKGIWDSYSLQLSGYKLLCEFNKIKIDRLAVLRLEENNYEFKEFKPRKEEFLAALKLYRWSKENAN